MLIHFVCFFHEIGRHAGDHEISDLEPPVDTNILTGNAYESLDSDPIPAIFRHEKRDTLEALPGALFLATLAARDDYDPDHVRSDARVFRGGSGRRSPFRQEGHRRLRP